MRLPNFLDQVDLNELRRQMGDPPLGEFTLVTSSSRLTIVELETLMTGGIDIQSLDEVVVLPDGTLAYKDRRVVLYIRDVAEYGRRGHGWDNLPKFHVSNCKKLRDMRAQKRYFRYVVAARMDGSFQINRIRQGNTQGSIERLKVCQYCLEQLMFEGFSREMDRSRRLAIVEAFTVPRFFEIWPMDVIDVRGLDNEASAPLNDYTGDFGVHSQAIKDAAGWTCTSCRRDLSAGRLRQFLHAHHLNGVKYDNRPQNLLALCIACHASQPGHGHMHGLPALATYRSQLAN